MDGKIRVLAINPGSTSTKIALFDDYEELFRKTISHSPEELDAYAEIRDQLPYRTEMVEKAMLEHAYALCDVNIFAGRGGGLLPVTGGVYEASDLLIEHASKGMTGQHPAQLGSQIARKLADKYNARAVVVNPPDVDEFDDAARVTGIKGVYRESHVHALNQKEIALRFCASRRVKYEEIDLIICHLGGGISVTAHKKGRMIDSNDIIKGSGPFSPTRSGDMPYMNIIDMAYSGVYTKKELTDKLNKDGGLTDHFGTAEVRDVLRLAESGDKYAKTVIHAMVYQIAKYVGAMAAALKGKAQAIILTGGISNSVYLTNVIRSYIDWICEVVIMPGDLELEALAAGAIRAERGEEQLKTYTGVPTWTGFER